MADVRLLELRKKKSTRRPKFLRQDYHHRMKVEDDLWRAPKGRHSKMKQRKRSHRASVAIGYRGPAEVRGLYKTGATIVRIENLQQLATIEPKKSVVILSSTVGAKKKYQLLKTAIEKGISVINIDAKKFITDFEAKLKAKTAKPEIPKLSEAQRGTAKQEVSLGKSKEEAKTEVKPKIEEKKTEKKTEVKTKEITRSPEHKVSPKTQEDKFGA